MYQPNLPQQFYPVLSIHHLSGQFPNLLHCLAKIFLHTHHCHGDCNTQLHILCCRNIGTHATPANAIVIGGAASSVSFGCPITLYRSSGAINAKVLCGNGDPNAVVTATQGSLYLRTDGSSTSTRAYINTNGGTAWTAITTAT